MSAKKAALTTLGCKVNHYETEAMRELFAQAGWEIVGFSDTADVYIVNTCTVTQTSDSKSRQMIARAHRSNPDALVVAVGCYAQVSPESVSALEGRRPRARHQRAKGNRLPRGTSAAKPRDRTEYPSAERTKGV